MCANALVCLSLCVYARSFVLRNDGISVFFYIYLRIWFVWVLQYREGHVDDVFPINRPKHSVARDLGFMGHLELIHQRFPLISLPEPFDVYSWRAIRRLLQARARPMLQQQPTTLASLSRVMSALWDERRVTKRAVRLVLGPFCA